MSRHPTRPGDDRRTRVGPVLFVLLIGAVSFSLAQTTVLAALPEIARRFDSSTVTASWTVTAYLLSASVSTPLAGKLGDVFGKGRVLGWVLLIFSAGSVVCALASSIEVLIAGRVLQGVAGGVFPLAFGIVHDELPPERVALGVALVSAMFGAGAAAGLPVAGLVIDHGELSWIFWGMLIALPGALAAWRILPAPRSTLRRHVDWAGAALLSVGLASALLGISKANGWGWTAPSTLVSLLIGVGVLVLFVAHQMHVREPLIEMRVLRSRPVLATNVAGLCSGMAMFSAFVLVPQLAQTPKSSGYGLGLTLTQAGLVTAPMVAMMLFAAPLAGAWGRRYGFRATLATGLVLGAIAFVLLATEHSSTPALLTGVVVLGVGIALAFAGMSMLIIAAVPAVDIGIATGINTVTRTAGAAFGTAIVTAILTADRRGRGRDGGGVRGRLPVLRGGGRGRGGRGPVRPALGRRTTVWSLLQPRRQSGGGRLMRRKVAHQRLQPVGPIGTLDSGLGGSSSRPSRRISGQDQGGARCGRLAPPCQGLRGTGGAMHGVPRSVKVFPTYERIA